MKDIEKYARIYKQGLLDNIIPFWVRHSIDREYGGFMFALDQDGSVVDTDKGVWQHGRFTWMLATLYNEVEQRDEWLNLALHGAKFLEDHCIDNDGRMFFIVDREGDPVRKRRYVYSETFAAIAFAALYKATGIEKYEQLSRKMFSTFLEYSQTPGMIPAKFQSIV